MSRQAKQIISAFLIIAIVAAGAYGAYYMWWGHRHKVLYNVTEVHVVQDEKDKNLYRITYDCEVKNWWFDSKERIIQLNDGIDGSYSTWDFKGKSCYFSTSQRTKSFKIEAKFKLDSYWDKALTLTEKELGIEPVKGDTKEQRAIRKVIAYSRFEPIDLYDKEVEGCWLYMQDYPDAKVIFD